MPFVLAEPPSLLTLSETARRARISRRQIRKAIDAGELRPVYLAGRAWIGVAECGRFCQQLQVGDAGWCGGGHAGAVA
jgi:hypothetical protein